MALWVLPGPGLHWPSGVSLPPTGFPWTKAS